MGKTIEVQVTKTVTVDVDETVTISHEEVLDALKEDSNFDFDSFLENEGFIRQDLLKLSGSILDKMKLELIQEIMQKASLEQLEQFKRSI